MRILFFFFSLLCAMLLCLSAIACKLFVVAANNVVPIAENQIAVLSAQAQPMASENLSITSIPMQIQSPIYHTDKMCLLPIPKLSQKTDANIFESSVSNVSDEDVFVTAVVNGTEMRLSLQEYLIGVLLAELPMGFCEDARYAQAVAARSYVMYCADRGMRLTSAKCAYFTKERANAFYKHLYETAYAQAREAVMATDGIVLTYEGEVCMAAFHAMSYDETESAEAVWKSAIPYLVPVKTPEDIELGGMQTQRTFSATEISALLGTKCLFPMTFSLTEGGRVEAVTFANGVSFDGNEVRRALSLRSTAFSVIRQDREEVVLDVVGFGHGVGMSQWGAQMMALDGYDWQEILCHYYPNTTFSTLDDVSA